MPKVTKNLENMTSKANETKVKVDAVVSSVIITYVFTKYEVNLKTNEHKILLHCLSLPPVKNVCCQIMESINKIDEIVLR